MIFQTTTSDLKMLLKNRVSGAIVISILMICAMIMLSSCSLFHATSDGGLKRKSYITIGPDGKVVGRSEESEMNYAGVDIQGKRSLKMVLDNDPSSPGFGHIKAVDIESETDASPAVENNKNQFATARAITKDTIDGTKEILKMAGEFYTGRTASGGLPGPGNAGTEAGAAPSWVQALLAEFAKLKAKVDAIAPTTPPAATPFGSGANAPTNQPANVP